MTKTPPANEKFALKNVTIVIDQTPMEREKGLYYLRATNVNSPLQAFGTPEELGTRFGQWLSNTIAVMQKNDCKTIKIDMKWEL